MLPCDDNCITTKRTQQNTNTILPLINLLILFSKVFVHRKTNIKQPAARAGQGSRERRANYVLCSRYNKHQSIALSFGNSAQSFMLMIS